MNKSESIINLVQATIKVMSDVKGIDKTMTIGEGKNSYKGVSDQEVKKVIGDSMEKNGLAIFPIGIDQKSTLSNWDEVDQWSKSTPKEVKRKQSIFTEVKTTYLLTHISGEFIEICGFGHGVDSQDKSAGKATTYALKYALLYTFLIPTGKIDDADNTHSDELPVTPPPAPVDQLPIAVAEMKSAKTLDELKNCWTKWKKYQKESTFSAMKDEVKARLTPKPTELSPELDKLLTQSIATFESVDSMDKATAIWNSTPELQTNVLFANAFSEAKKRLNFK